MNGMMDPSSNGFQWILTDLFELEWGPLGLKKGYDVLDGKDRAADYCILAINIRTPEELKKIPMWTDANKSMRVVYTDNV